MTEISDLKRRVEAVGEKFGRLAEQEDSYGERLAGLLNAVEEGFARTQRETQKLKNELESARDEVMKLTGELEVAKHEARRRGSELDGAKAERDKLASELAGVRDESKQLRGMLLTLLEAVESGGTLDPGAAMSKLESRIDRIVSSTDGNFVPAPTLASAASEAAASPAAVAPTEVKSQAADEPAPKLTVSAMPTPEAAGAAPAVSAPGKDEAVLREVVASATEPAAPAAPAEPKAPPRAEKAAASERRAAEPPSDDDLSAVNKIIQRISLLTGEFVESSHKRSAAAEEKPIPSLKVGNGAGAAGEAGSGADKPRSEDESTAKTS